MKISLTSGVYKKALNKALYAGIGTEENPIKLVFETGPREGLDKKLYYKSDHQIEPQINLSSMYSSDDFEWAIFEKNVIHNPNLSKKEIEVALFLFEELYHCYPKGEIYATNSPTVNFDGTKQYGDEDGLLHIGNVDTKNTDYLFVDCNNLIALLGCKGIKISPNRLSKILKNLHDYSYITVTDIHVINTYMMSAYSNPQSRSGIRARIRHIRLCVQIMRKDIAMRWKT